jgi:hypothetical protein
MSCRVCSCPALPGEELCIPCSAELAYRIMAAEPDPSYRTCIVCRAPYGYTEARVIRSVKNLRAGSTETPWLCWVCARLHLSAREPENIPHGM